MSRRFRVSPIGRFLLAVLLPLLLLAGCGSPDETASRPAYPPFEGELQKPSAPVWLIGIDGAGWNLIEPMLARGELPALAALAERGTYGILRSENPTISPALWATIATGHPRDVHGVINFTSRRPQSYAVGEAGPLDRRSPAIWDYVGAAGGSSTVISWFGSFPAENIDGIYLAKGLDPSDPQPGQVHPQGWLAGASAMREPGAAAREAIAKTPFLADALRDDQRTMDLLRAAAERDAGDLVVAYFAGIDIAQHVTWKDMDPDYEGFPDEPARREELAGVIPAYYRYVDELIGEIVNLAPEEATIVIVSDHGGGPMLPEEAFHFQLEVLLEQLGYTRKGEDGPDWSATTAFAISELYRERKRIWLNLDGIEPEGIVPLDQARDYAATLATELRGLRTTGAPLFDEVTDRTRDDNWVPGEPALSVRFSTAALTAGEVRGGDRTLDMNAVRLRHRDVSGGHRLDGLFLAAGPAVPRRKLSRPTNLYQIAPTILHWLGLPQAATMLEHAPAEGGVLVEAVAPDHLDSRPLQTGRYPLARRARRDDGADAADPAQQAAFDRLRSLGYLE